MSSDALLILRTLFSSIWSLFTSWFIPGTRVTPAAWAMFVLGTVVIFRFLKRVFNITSHDK